MGVNLQKVGETELVVAVAVPFVFFYILLFFYSPFVHAAITASAWPRLLNQCLICLPREADLKFVLPWSGGFIPQRLRNLVLRLEVFSAPMSISTRELATFWLYDMSHCEGLQCLLSNEVSSLYCNRSMVIIIIIF